MNSSFIHWDIDPEIIKLFGKLSIRYYGLLFMFGILFCYFIVKWIYKREGIPVENLETLSIYTIIGMLTGSRLGHCLFYNIKYYIAHPLEIILPIRIIEGHIKFTGYQGLASHGSVIGLFLALYIYSRRTKNSFLQTLDIFAIVSGLSSGFIRLGNFMNSEIVGTPSTLPWAIIFDRVSNTARHPSQLYEAIVYFFVFGFMIFLYLKKGDQLKNGVFFGLNIVIIFCARFLLEFTKKSQTDFLGAFPLNMGQILSIPFVIIGAIFLYNGLKKTAISSEVKIELSPVSADDV